MFNNKQTPEQLAKKGGAILSVFKTAINDLGSLIKEAQVGKKGSEAIITVEKSKVKKFDAIVEEYSTAKANIEKLIK